MARYLLATNNKQNTNEILLSSIWLKNILMFVIESQTKVNCRQLSIGLIQHSGILNIIIIS